MNQLSLSFRMLRRDWRAGELNVLVLALVIAVSGMTTVSFFTDRVELALSRESNQLLGADLLVISSNPLPEEYLNEAVKRNLMVSTVTRFPSMISNGDDSQLSEIKAVTDGYPLRGRLYLASKAASAAQLEYHVADKIPLPGTVWIDEKLMVRLGLRQGDRVDVGATQLTVAELIMREPDHSVGFMSMGSRAIINADDLPATGLIQQGSRISYQLLIAGESGMVEKFREWITPQLKPSERTEGIRDARPEIRAALERAEKFLSLAALASVVLAAAAIALAVRRFSQRHLDGCAVMRSLGASQAKIFFLYLFYFLMLGLMASSVGCILAFAAQEILAIWLTGIVETALPLPSGLPVIQGMLVGMVLLLGFALPPILNLRSVPALRVLRRDIGLSNSHSLAGYLLGLAVLSLLFIWKAEDLKLGFYIVAGFILAILFFGSLGWLLVKVLSGLRHQAGGAWRYGLANIHRRAISSIVQVVALGLGLMALLVLTLIQDDLIEDWHTSLPPDAPNHFLVNIQEDQLPALEEFFTQYSIEQPPLFPMVKGRLIEINGEKVSADDYADPQVQGLVRREFNLSWRADLPNDNQIVAGNWWKSDNAGESIISMENEIARKIGIKLGDQVTYDIAGRALSATVASLRKVDWDTFRVNFFVVAPPGLLDDFPVSYITSFYVPPVEQSMMHELVRAFPNILVVDVAIVINQVQQMIQQVTKAIEFVFIFTVLAGFSVLYAAIAATQDERIYEAAIFRTLGAKREQLTRAWAAEFAILGGLAGLFASVGASILGYVIGHFALHITYTFNPWVWLVGTLIGVIGVTSVGLLGTRMTLTSPPLLTLRKIA